MLFEEITLHDYSYQLGQVTSLDLHMIDVNYKDATLKKSYNHCLSWPKYRGVVPGGAEGAMAHSRPDPPKM